MRTYKNILILLACAAMAASCGSKDPDDCGCDNPGEGNNTEQQAKEAIMLSGIHDTEVMVTRADFPNAKRIGVVAAYYNGGNTDWMSYNDINNAVATAGTDNSGIYPFTWDTQRYWPLDNSELVFMAYSPHSSDSPGVTLRADRTTLDLSLQQDMPDVMYASNNAAPVPYRKNPLQVVDLGTFKHVFSQVTVKVESDDEDLPSPLITLTSLQLNTTKRNATLKLPEGDSGLHLWADEAFAYDMYTGSYDFSSTPYTSSVFVYPETEDVTSISVKLKDGDLPDLVEKVFSINPDFDNTTSPGDPIVFERAKNTTLTIKVSRKTIQNPDEEFNLQGEVTDWIPKGDFGITIN